MRTRGVRIVGEQNIAGLNTLFPPKCQFGFDHIAHTANEHRQAQSNGERLTVAIKEAHREIERLINDHVVRGSHPDRFHLLGGGH